jgi:hypothetical protein
MSRLEKSVNGFLTYLLAAILSLVDPNGVDRAMMETLVEQYDDAKKSELEKEQARPDKGPGL